MGTDIVESPRPLNTELLQATLAQIKARPGEWFQHEWAMRTECGTSYCFAGTAIRLVHPDAEFVFDRPVEHLGGDAATFVRINGRTLPVEPVAAQLLGLNTGECNRMFSASQLLEDLEADVRTLCDPAYDRSLNDGWQ